MSSPFSHIAVPVDGSVASERGVRFAIELARGGAAVTFCNVIEPATACLPMAEGAAIDPGPLLQVLNDNAKRTCRDARTAAEQAGISATSQVLYGDRVDALEEFVRTIGADAVVIGTNGRSGIERAAFGSMTEGLLCGSDVPVIAVHAGDVTQTGPVAVAVDDSPPARAAFDLALRFARAWGARLDIIHVAKSPGAAGTPPFLDDLEDAARDAGVPFDVTTCTGDAADEIVRVSQALGCSTIVIGTHGRRAVPRFFLGSVANRVVELACVPVTVVRGRS